MSLRIVAALAVTFLAGCASLRTVETDRSGSLQPNRSVEQGREIYYRACTACHSADPVSAYSLAEWSEIVDSMAPRAKLDEQRQAALLAYIAAVARGATN